MASYCKICGMTLPETVTFCGNCGAAVSQSNPWDEQPKVTQPQEAQPQEAQPQEAQPQEAQPHYIRPEMPIHAPRANEYCETCGRMISEGATMCDNCSRTDAVVQQNLQPHYIRPEVPILTPQSQPVTQPLSYAQQPVAQPQQSMYQRVPVYRSGNQTGYGSTSSMEAAPRADGQYGIVSVGAYFGLMLLFSIPICGTIASLIIALTARNVNRKAFAWGGFIWSFVWCALLLFICT